MVIGQLQPVTRYCFSLRARTEGGTQGCVSDNISNVACVSTLPAGQPTLMLGTSAATPAITIKAEGRPGNTIGITGQGFLRKTPVSIRVTDQTLPMVLMTAIGGQRITSGDDGKVTLTFVGLCKHPGLLYFSAEDGRRVPATMDVTGTLWSNTQTITCT